MATEIEELYGTPVEAIIVGDSLVDERVEQALAAAREAVVNAAKHAQTEQIDVYVEISSEQIEIFVRDRGIGFEKDSIDSDRRGIRESIEARMKRIGGSSSLVSTLGEGTEVELLVPLVSTSNETEVGNGAPGASSDSQQFGNSEEGLYS